MTDRDLLLQIHMASRKEQTMTDHDLLLQIQALITSQLAPIHDTPPYVPPPFVPPYVPPADNPPADERAANFERLVRPLWEGGQWFVGFSRPGESHTTTYVVPAGTGYPDGRVQLIGDSGFPNGHILAVVDGSPVIHGGPIPVTPGSHTLTAICADNAHTQVHGAMTAFRIINQ